MEHCWNHFTWHLLTLLKKAVVPRSSPLAWKSPWTEEPGGLRSMGRRSLVGCGPWDGGAWWAAVHGVAKSRARLSDFTFTFHFHALEKEMATHASVPAWRIPGMGEPGGLPSMGSQSRTRLKRLSSSSSSSLPSLYILIVWSH